MLRAIPLLNVGSGEKAMRRLEFDAPMRPMPRE